MAVFFSLAFAPCQGEIDILTVENQNVNSSGSVGVSYANVLSLAYTTSDNGCDFSGATYNGKAVSTVTTGDSHVSTLDPNAVKIGCTGGDLRTVTCAGSGGASRDGEDTVRIYVSGASGLCPACGNGVVETGEVCDDNNTANCDGCSSNCAVIEPLTCGDGIVCPPEQCDYGNGYCNPDCTMPRCGDGIINISEDAVFGLEYCDDGDATHCGACDGICSGAGIGVAVCGDGVVCGESCDEIDAGGPSTCIGNCNATCDGPANICGDGIERCGEICDDGNTNNCLGSCRGDCMAHAGCGDGIVCPPEECDEGITDACTTTCGSNCMLLSALAAPGLSDPPNHSLSKPALVSNTPSGTLQVTVKDEQCGTFAVHDTATIRLMQPAVAADLGTFVCDANPVACDGDGTNASQIAEIHCDAASMTCPYLPGDSETGFNFSAISDGSYCIEAFTSTGAEECNPADRSESVRQNVLIDSDTEDPERPGLPRTQEVRIVIDDSLFANGQSLNEALDTMTADLFLSATQKAAARLIILLRIQALLDLSYGISMTDSAGRQYGLASDTTNPRIEFEEQRMVNIKQVASGSNVQDVYMVGAPLYINETDNRDTYGPVYGVSPTPFLWLGWNTVDDQAACDQSATASMIVFGDAVDNSDQIRIDGIYSNGTKGNLQRNDTDYISVGRFARLFPPDCRGGHLLPVEANDPAAYRLEDIARMIGKTTAHELGHSLGLEHTDFLSRGIELETMIGVVPTKEGSSSEYRIGRFCPPVRPLQHLMNLFISICFLQTSILIF